MIARANMAGVFKDPIDWEVSGKGESLSVTAFAIIARTGKRVEATADMAMAKAENWTKNAKYRTMPELMLRYRSASMLIRLYCPDVMIGLPPAIDLELDREYRDVTPKPDVEPVKDSGIIAAIPPADDEQVEAKKKRKKVVKVDRTPPAPAQQEPEPAAAHAAEDENIDNETGEVLDKAQAPDGDDAGAADYGALADAIRKDLAASGSPGAVATFYAEQLAEMQATAPDVHAVLMRDFEAAENGG